MRKITTAVFMTITFIMFSNASFADWEKPMLLSSPRSFQMLNDSTAIYYDNKWQIVNVNNEKTTHTISNKFTYYGFIATSQDQTNGDIYVLSDSLYIYSGIDYSLKEKINTSNFNEFNDYDKFYFSKDMSGILKINKNSIKKFDIKTQEVSEKIDIDYKESDYRVISQESIFKIWGQTDSGVELLNLSTGNIEKSIEIKYDFNFLNISPDNNYLMISTEDEVQILDLETDEITKKISLDSNQTSYYGQITSNNKYLLIYINENDGKHGKEKVVTYDYNGTQKLYEMIIDFDNWYFNLEKFYYLTNNGQNLIIPIEYGLSCDYDIYSMYMYYNFDMQKNEIENVYPIGSIGYINNPIFTSDGKYLYTSGELKWNGYDDLYNVVLWDAETGEYLDRFFLDDKQPLFLSNDDKTLYSGDYYYDKIDSIYKYRYYNYDLNERKFVDSILFDNYKRFEKSPVDNELIYVNENKIYRYDLKKKSYKDSLTVMFSDTGNIESYRYVKEKNSLFVISSNFEIKELDLIDLSEKSYYKLDTLSETDRKSVDISPDGTHLLTYQIDTNYIFKVYDIKSVTLVYSKMIENSKREYSHYNDKIAEFLHKNNTIIVYNIHKDVIHNKQVILTVNSYEGFDLKNNKECFLNGISTHDCHVTQFLMSPSKESYITYEPSYFRVENTCEPLLTSIEEYSEETGGMVYPNPAIDYFKIKSDYPVDKVAIFDMLGREVFRHNGIIEQINTTDFERGVYIIKYQTINGMNYTDKVMVK